MLNIFKNIFAKKKQNPGPTRKPVPGYKWVKGTAIRPSSDEKYLLNRIDRTFEKHHGLFFGEDD